MWNWTNNSKKYYIPYIIMEDELATSTFAFFLYLSQIFSLQSTLLEHYSSKLQHLKYKYQYISSSKLPRRCCIMFADHYNSHIQFWGLLQMCHTSNWSFGQAWSAGGLLKF